jgi:hypothetical protein
MERTIRITPPIISEKPFKIEALERLFPRIVPKAHKINVIENTQREVKKISDSRIDIPKPAARASMLVATERKTRVFPFEGLFLKDSLSFFIPS